MNEVFLVSENYVRNLTNIDNNLQSKFLLSAIREAQEVHYQQVIGTKLLRKLKSLVDNDTINDNENVAYKDLIDNSQLFLAYQAVVELCLISSVKLSNGGLQQNSDENLSPLNVDETLKVKDLYQKKADFFRKRLMGYIIDHRTELPEINGNKCQDMYAELHSAASTNLWLGGARGRNKGLKCCKG